MLFGHAYQFPQLRPTLAMLTKGHAKIVPTGCFVSNIVDMTRSLFDWSSRGSFSKGKGQIAWLSHFTLTWQGFLSFCLIVIYSTLKWAPQLHLLLSMPLPPFFLTFSQPSVSEKQACSAIVARVLSSTGISVPLGRRLAFSHTWSVELTMGMGRVTPSCQATRSQSLLGPL